MRGERPRRILLLLAAGALVPVCAAVSACRRRPQLELRVGLILPMTGSLASLAEHAEQGARLAVAEQERAGGLYVDGKACRIVLFPREGKESPESAVAAAQHLINNEGVAAIVGPPLSAQAIPVARLASRSGVPMIAQIATNPEVTRGTTGVLRLCFVDTFQGQALARFAREELGASRAAVLYDTTSPFPRDIAAAFRSTFEGEGGAIVLSESFTTGEEDFTVPLGAIADSEAQVLFLPDYRSDLLRIGPQIRRLGLEVQILGCDTMRFATQEDARLFDGAYVTAHFAPDDPSPEIAAFAAAFRAAYAKSPTDAAALSYDAMNLLFRVARTQKSVDPKAIAAGLAEVREFTGVTGRMRFDGTPDPLKSVFIAEIRDGRMAYHSRVDP